MQIEIVEVSREDKPSSNGKGTYGQLTVLYKTNGKVAEKKLMSFVNPSVFKHLEKAQRGDSINVTSVKNEKTGFWDWTAIGGDEVATSTSAAPQSTNTRVTGSNYETKEERALRQRYIIRQSSISSAVASLVPGAKSALNAGDVLRLAKEFEDYVFSEDGLSALTELTSDIPE